MKTPISVTILTKNSEKYIKKVLDSVVGFDEIIVCDTGSTDQTAPIVKKFEKVKIFSIPFTGFGSTHNKASSFARNDWILSIDSDEVVSPELWREVSSLDMQRGCVYSIPRKNEYRGKWIRTCGWYPDRCLRLYHRLDTQFSDAQVHESLISDQLKIIYLHSPLFHYSYEQVSDFLQKMETYSSLFALQNRGKISSSLTKAILRGSFTFFKCYFLKRGFLDGREGFEISLYNGLTTFYKYLKLWETNDLISQIKSS